MQVNPALRKFSRCEMACQLVNLGTRCTVHIVRIQVPKSNEQNVLGEGDSRHTQSAQVVTGTTSVIM